MRDKTSFKSLLRAINILDLFQKEQTMLPVPDISAALRIPRSTTYKYLAVLREHGFVDYDEQSGKYKLGMRLFEFGSFIKSQTSIDKLALPYMSRLAREVGETVMLTVRGDNAIYCLEHVEYVNGIIFSVERGARFPLYSGASARTFLAFLPDDEIENVLREAVLVKYTDTTITDPEELKKNLMEIRKVGYAYSDQEIYVGARAISAPIFNPEGQVIACLAVIGPVQRMDDEKIDALKALVVGYAGEISGVKHLSVS
jgi:DNA-binding IclR family transcriptional regulator